jgi:hypothetical protein
MDWKVHTEDRKSSQETKAPVQDGHGECLVKTVEEDGQKETNLLDLVFDGVQRECLKGGKIIL